MAPPVIETDRLVLRAFREDDLDAYAEMGQDPEVMRGLRLRIYRLDRPAR